MMGDPADDYERWCIDHPDPPPEDEHDIESVSEREADYLDWYARSMTECALDILIALGEKPSLAKAVDRTDEPASARSIK